MTPGNEESTPPLGTAVLEELKRLAFANLTDYVDFRSVKKRGTDEVTREYTIKDSRKVDGAPISEVAIAKDGSMKFKLYDKMKALELLGRSAGVFTAESGVEEPEPELSLAEAQAVILQAAKEMTVSD